MALAEEATKAQGNAMANQEKYLDSYGGKLQALSTASDEFWLNFLNSDALKNAIVFLTNIVNFFAKMADYSGTLTTISAFFTISLVKGIGSYIKESGGLIKSITSIYNSLTAKTAATVADAEATAADALANQASAEAFYEDDTAALVDAGGLTADTTAATADATAHTANAAANQANAGALYEDGAAAVVDEGGQAADAVATTANTTAHIGLKLALAGVIAVLAAAVVAWIAYATSLKKARKDLAEAKEEFDKANTEIKNQENALDSVNEKIKEYIELKEKAGSLSLADEDELENLKKEAKEIQRNIALEKEKRAEAAKNTIDSTGSVFDKLSGYEDNLETAIRIKTTDPKDLEAWDAVKGLTFIDPTELSQTDALFEVYNAYKDIIDIGYRLTTEQQKEYNEVSRLVDKYYDYLYAVNQTKDNYLALSEASKRAVLVNKLEEDGLSKSFAKDVVDSLTVEELDVAYDVKPILTLDENKYEKEYEKYKNNLTNLLSNEGLNSSEISDIEAKIKTGNLGEAFGNVNLANIGNEFWTEEGLKKYERELTSLGFTIDELKGKMNALAITQEKGGYAFSLSPMLQTENGPVPLDSDAVQNYLKALIEYASQDDGVVTMEELLKLDKSGELGFMYGDNLVKGIIAGITDSSGNNTGKYSANALTKILNLNNFFKGMPVKEGDVKDYADKRLGRLKDEIQNSVLKVSSPTIVFEKVNGLNEGLSALTSIYKDVMDGETFDYSALFDDKFKELFKDYEEEYNNFIETVMNNPGNIEATQEAFNKLGTAYIRNSKALEEVTEKTKEATIAWLKQQGVANATEVVESAIRNNLAQAKQILIDADIDLIKYTDEEIELFIKEGQYSDDLANRIRFLAIQEKIANKALDTSDGIKQLKALAAQAAISIETIIELENTMAEMKTALANGTTINGRAYQKGDHHIYDYYTKQINKLKEAAMSDINTDINNAQISILPEIDFTGAKDSSSSAENETKETLDWIERAIKKIERAISQAENKASDTWRTWSDRNSELVKEFGLVEQKIGAQADAYATYMKAADMVQLDEHYKQLVRDGAMAIETITDSDLKDAISQYTDFYDKAMDANDALEELRDQIAQIARTKFDNIKAEFDGMLSLIEHTSNMVDAFMDQTETRGYVLSQKYYETLIASTEESISKQQEELDKLSKSLKDSLDAGYIKMYSQEWYELNSEIFGVEEALTEATNKLYEYNKAMRELDWSIFELQEDYISRIAEESDFLIELLSEQEKELFNPEGKFGLSNMGTSVAGLHALNYDTYMAEADDYANKIKEIDKLLEKDANNKDLIDKRNEYLKAQRDNIKAAEDEKKAIQDLIRSSYDALLEALQKLIDKRKEALQAQKDLYDYEKNIKEKTDNISSLQKQLMAYAGDNSEETKATVQRLTTQLAEAEEDLQETEYEKWLSDQTEMLDNFYNEVEEWLNSRLDDIEGLLADIIANTNENATTIHDTIVSESDKVGYTITDKMDEIWSQQQAGTDAVVALYSDFGEYSVNALSAINGVKSKIQEMISHSDQIASTLVSSIRDAVTGIGEYVMRAGQAGSVSLSGGGGANPGGNNPGGNNTNTNTNPNNGNSGKYWIVNQNNPNSKNTGMTTALGGPWSNSSEAWDALYQAWLDDDIQDMSAYGYSKFHKGLLEGIVGKKTSRMNDFDLLKAFSIKKFDLEPGEVPAILKEGEAVMTPEQMHNIANAVRLADYDSGLYAMQQKFIAATLGENGIMDNMRSGLRNSMLNSANGIHGTGGTVNNDITLNVALPNVTDVDGFINELKTNKRFEKVIQAMTVDTAMGRNSLRKLSF